MSETAQAKQERKEEGERLAAALRKWARAAFNQEMQRTMLTAADWIEQESKK